MCARQRVWKIRFHSLRKDTSNADGPQNCIEEFAGLLLAGVWKSEPGSPQAVLWTLFGISWAFLHIAWMPMAQLLSKNLQTPANMFDFPSMLVQSGSLIFHFCVGLA